MQQPHEVFRFNRVFVAVWMALEERKLYGYKPKRRRRKRTTAKKAA